jgi:hypothetical protein
MADFLEIVSAGTGRRLIVNMAHVIFIKESNTGGASLWLMKPREHEVVEPKESFEQIRKVML